MAGFSNDVVFGTNVDFSGAAQVSGQITADGQLLIGSATAPFLTASTLSTTRDLLITNGSGTIDLTLDDNTHTTSIEGWNGSIIESAAVIVTSDGATITFSVEQNGGGNLTVIFSDGFYDWITAPDTIALTAGTDVNPQINYVYFLQSTKALTISTSAFPSAEHAPLATVLCQSAASLASEGSYKMHAWTDHVMTTNDQGHIGDLNKWIRAQNATWISGVAPTLTITPQGAAPDNVIITTTAGVAQQLHTHAFPAFTGTPDIYVVNNFATKFVKVTDLNTQLTDSVNASLSGKFYSLVIWGVVSEASGDCKLMCNLPSGSYNNTSSLTADNSKFADFSIPTDFVGTGFLIAQLNLRHQAAAGGTWTEIETIDLRGFLPNIVAGGGTALGSVFIDTVFRVVDDGNNTKEIAFEASGITAATTRTITMADEDIDMTPGTGSYLSSTPAVFLAYLASSDNDVTGTGTEFTIGSTTALTEVIDIGGNFNTNGTFTAPQTGRYFLQMRITATGATIATDYNGRINTSNRSYNMTFQKAAGTEAETVSVSTVSDMETSDTATAIFSVSGEAGDTVDCNGGATLNTAFSGHLIS